MESFAFPDRIDTLSTEITQDLQQASFHWNHLKTPFMFGMFSRRGRHGSIKQNINLYSTKTSIQFLHSVS